MATQVTQTLKKPAGINFYMNETDSRFQDLISALPGYVSYTKTYPDENTKVQVFAFETHDHYVGYLDMINTNQVTIDNRNYNIANNISYEVAVAEI